MFLRTALLASAIVLSAIAAPQAQADEVGTLRIELTGLAPQGQILLQVFNSEAGYGSGQGVTARRIAVDAATQSVQIEGLAPGQYAVRLFHDVDGNGELNTNPFGIPTEPFAFSNNARGRFGPASWADAAFTLNAGDNLQAIAVGGQ